MIPEGRGAARSSYIQTKKINPVYIPNQCVIVKQEKQSSHRACEI